MRPARRWRATGGRPGPSGRRRARCARPRGTTPRTAMGADRRRVRAGRGRTRRRPSVSEAVAAAVTGHRTGGWKKGVRTDPASVDGERYPGFEGRRPQAVREAGARACREAAVEGRRQVRQRPDPRGHRQRDCPESVPGLVDRSVRRHLRSISSARPAVGAHRQPAADDLAEAGQVGHARGTPPARRPSPCTEAGDDLVEDQQRCSCSVAQPPAARPGTRRARRHDPHVAGDRLDDDRRDRARGARGRRRSLRTRRRCSRCDQGVRRRPRWATPGLVGHAERGGARAGLDQEGVAVAVVAAGELDDPIPPRRRPRQRAPRSSSPRCPSSRTGHARSTAPDGGPGRPSSTSMGRRRAEARARGPPRTWASAGAELPRRVPVDQRTPRHDVVDVAPPVDVVQTRAAGALDEGRRPPTAPKARTGLLTPPGRTRRARLNRRDDSD